MNNCHRIVSLIFPAVLLLTCSHLRAASVTSAGYTNDFSAQPAAGDFSTRSIGAAAGDVTTAAGVDSAVQTNTASLMTAQCASATGTPPAAAGAAVWSSAGGYLQTRPTQNSITLLMATLVNNSGSDATGVRIIYDFVTN